MIKRGAIVLIPFPFTDLSSQRIRPALVVSDDEKSGDDAIVVFISSVIPRHIRKTEFVIMDTHPSFLATGLKVPSVIKCDKIATLDRRIIIGEMGHITEAIQKEIDARLCVALRLNPMKTRGSSAGGRKR